LKKERDKDFGRAWKKSEEPALLTRAALIELKEVNPPLSDD